MINLTNSVNHGTENIIDFFQDTSFSQGDHPWYEDKQAFLHINTSFFGHFNVADPDGYADTESWGTMLRPYNGDNPDAHSAGTTGYNYSGAWAYTIPAVHPPEMQEAAFKFAEFIGVHPTGRLCLPVPSESTVAGEGMQREPGILQRESLLERRTRRPVARYAGANHTGSRATGGDPLQPHIEEAYFGVKSAADALNDAHEEMQSAAGRILGGIRRRKYVAAIPHPPAPSSPSLWLASHKEGRGGLRLAGDDG